MLKWIMASLRTLNFNALGLYQLSRIKINDLGHPLMKKKTLSALNLASLVVISFRSFKESQ